MGGKKRVLRVCTARLLPSFCPYLLPQIASLARGLADSAPPPARSLAVYANCACIRDFEQFDGRSLQSQSVGNACNVGKKRRRSEQGGNHFFFSIKEAGTHEQKQRRNGPASVQGHLDTSSLLSTPLPPFGTDTTEPGQQWYIVWSATAAVIRLSLLEPLLAIHRDCPATQPRRHRV